MPESAQQKLGTLIHEYRLQSGMTQQQLAEHLKTSQSAIARIERGEQNLTTEMIGKIGRVFNKSLVTIANSTTLNFKVNGGKQLSGTATVKTAKNSATGLLCAALLNRNATTLKHLPRIEEVYRIIEVLQSIGVHVQWMGEDAVITPPKKYALENLDTAAAQKTRSVIMLIAPFAHLFKEFTIPHAGGCNLGERSVEPHIQAFSDLGIQVTIQQDHYRISAERPAPATVILSEAGDTVTENALMAAAKLPGTSVIKYASANYQVQDLCYFLQELGVAVEGIGTTTLIVHGKPEIDTPVTYELSEDPTEAMFFLAAAAVTHSPLVIARAPHEFLELELSVLESMGFNYEIVRSYKGRNEHVSLVDIQVHPSQLTAAPGKIAPRPYPGLNIDNVPFFAVIATQAKGQTLIHDWVYEGRALHYTELNKLGARTLLADPHRIYITGPTTLMPTDMVCPPALRPAAILLIGMLAAQGTSILRNVYSINRGYEDLAQRLCALGADVELLADV